MTKKYTRLSSCIRYFNQCGNSCDFCFQKYPTFLKKFNLFQKHSLEAIRENNKALVDYIYNVQKPFDTYTFKLMGGQLFQFTQREMFIGMAQTIQMIYKVLDDFDVYRSLDQLGYTSHVILLSSNLLFEDQSLLYYTLDMIRERKKINARMMFSFDCYGRFKTRDDLCLFRKNLLQFDQRYHDVALPIVSFVLTKQNMQAMYNQEKTQQMRVLNQLYDSGFVFDVTMLANDHFVDSMKYSLEDLEKFKQILKTRYPQIVDVYKNQAYHRSLRSKFITVQDKKILNDLQCYDKSQNIGSVMKKCIVCDRYNVCSQMLPERDYNVTDCDIKSIFLS